MVRSVMLAVCFAAAEIASGCTARGHMSVTGPGGKVSHYVATGQVQRVPAPAAEAPAGTDELLTASRKLIRDAGLTVSVGNTEAAAGKARDIARSMGGYAESASLDRVVLRVPSERFDQTLAALGKLGLVVDRKVEVRDVTEAYADLELRLKSKRAVLARYQELLKRAEKVEDVLKVETELARLTLEIEGLEGKLRRMKSQVAFSRIAVRFVLSTESPERAVTLPFWWLSTLGLDLLLEN